MLETAHTLTQKLAQETFDCIWNIGVCGRKHLDTPRFFQVSRILNIHTGKELIVPPFVHIGPLHGIYCSDVPVSDATRLQEEAFVDMESFAVEFIAQKYATPRLLCKVPVDVVGEETHHFDRTKALDLLQNNVPYKNILSTIYAYCSQQKQSDTYAWLRSHLRVTHRSFEILCDSIRAYEVLSGHTFRDIFAQHQRTDAKSLQQWVEGEVASLKIR